MIYAMPVLSLLWLFFFADAEVARFDYLVIGAAAIITANLLINFEAEIRWGFRALLLALGTFGAVVYLRDGVFKFLGVDPWRWTGGGYFESITSGLRRHPLVGGLRSMLAERHDAAYRQ